MVNPFLLLILAIVGILTLTSIFLIVKYWKKPFLRYLFLLLTIAFISVPFLIQMNYNNSKEQYSKDCLGNYSIEHKTLGIITLSIKENNKFSLNIPNCKTKSISGNWQHFYGYMHGLIEFNSKQHSLISAEISTDFNSIKVLQSENLENCDIEKLTLFKN